MNHEILAENVNRQLAEKIPDAIANTYHVKTFMLVQSANDTNYTYNVYAENRLNKSLSRDIKQFISGMIYLFKSY